MRPVKRLRRIDRRAFEAVAAARLPGLEYVLPRLSRTADHGVLWMAAAASMGAGRRPRLRRAALRGLIAVGLASPVVNFFAKQTFRRHRPVIDLVPPVRVRWKIPSSHAFPSGHSASAAAFATGVAMEAPAAVAGPVAALGAAVAFSRIYNGAHYPGDVLAGAGIGVLAGLVTRVAWPARPPVAHVAPLDETARADPRGRGLVAVINAVDGDLIAQVLREELPAAECVVVGPEDDLPEALGKAARRAEVLAVAGGDGTVNAGAEAALRHRIPLLTVPGGTLDHFSRALGVETPADAVAAYRAGRRARVDVGVIDGVAGAGPIFLNTAGVGAYAELVDRRERLEGRIGKWPALALAAVRVLRRFEPVEMVVNGRPRRVWLAFFGNGLYGARGATPTWRQHLDDGQLDVRMITVGAGRPRVLALASLLLGHLHLVPGYHAWHGTGVEISGDREPLRIALDGETRSLSGPVELRKRPAALIIFCPA